MSTTPDTTRALLAIHGEDRIPFLQGLLTQDVTKLAADNIQFAALLSPQGKILHDMFLIDAGDHILLDTAAAYKDTLIKRLTMYKLRAKVTISEAPNQHIAYSPTDGLPDPRHPHMPRRIYIDTTNAHFPPPACGGRLGGGSASHTLNAKGEDSAPSPLKQGISPVSASPACGRGSIDYHTIRLDLGIPELGPDFAPDEITAMDAGYDLLNAISFTKGCYVGQEVTARMHYKNIARRGFYQLNAPNEKTRLMILKFEETGESKSDILVDNKPFRATLPAWLKPKYMQFLENQKKQ